jgi:hypothetical protein
VIQIGWRWGCWTVRESNVRTTFSTRRTTPQTTKHHEHKEHKITGRRANEQHQKTNNEARTKIKGKGKGKGKGKEKEKGKEDTKQIRAVRESEQLRDRLLTWGENSMGRNQGNGNETTDEMSELINKPTTRQ